MVKSRFKYKYKLIINLFLEELPTKKIKKENKVKAIKTDDEIYFNVFFDEFITKKVEFKKKSVSTKI